MSGAGKNKNLDDFEAVQDSSDEDYRNGDKNLNSKVLAKRFVKGVLEYRFFSAEIGLLDWAKRSYLIDLCPQELREAEKSHFKKKAVKLKEHHSNFPLKDGKSYPGEVLGKKNSQNGSFSEDELTLIKKRDTLKRRKLSNKYFYHLRIDNGSNVVSDCDGILCRPDAHSNTFDIVSNPPTGSLFKTGLAFDEDCSLHFGSPEEPESPERYELCMEALTLNGLKSRCFPILSRKTQKELSQLIKNAHSKEHLDALLSVKERLGFAIVESIENESYYESQFTTNAVNAATAQCSELVSLVYEGKLDNGFSLIRPPGHHCDYDRKYGFCHVNNIAIAAKTILRKNPEAKIAIFDWDLHHGNGTEEIFYDEPNVLYISVHQQFDQFGKHMFPGTGGLSDVGGRNTRGTNMNIPIPIGCGDSEYRIILDMMVSPVLKEFNADICLISAGFDSCVGDPLGLLEVTPRMFSYMTRRFVKEQRNGKVVMFLEGGYNSKMVAECVCSCVASLLGNEDGYDPSPSTEKDFLIYLDALIKAHRIYWKPLFQSQPLEDVPQTLIPHSSGYRLKNSHRINFRSKKIIALKRYRDLHPEMEPSSVEESDSDSSFVMDSQKEDTGKQTSSLKRKGKKRRARNNLSNKNGKKLNFSPLEGELKLVTKRVEEVIDLTADEKYKESEEAKKAENNEILNDISPPEDVEDDDLRREKEILNRRENGDADNGGDHAQDMQDEGIDFVVEDGVIIIE